MNKAVDLSAWAKAHEMMDEQRFKFAADAMGDIRSELRFIRENHLDHMEDDIKVIGQEISSLEAHMTWIKWLALAALGVLITGVGGLFFHTFVAR